MKVPKGWEVKQIKSLGNVVSGGTPNTDILKYWNGSINWATPTDITKLQGIYIRETERKISKEGLQNSSAKILPKGSLLVCTRATIGYMAITVNETSTNQGFKNLIPNDKNLVEFLYYILTYERYKLISKANGSTFIEVSKKDFENIKLLIPPLPEQRKIAKILGCWDRAITACEQLIATSKQQKQALMQQLLTAKKRFGEFSGEWEEVRLGDLGTTYNGLVGKTKIDFGTGEKYIPYINIFKNSSVDINSLDLVNIKSNEKQNVVKYGDIFFTTSSETPEEVGMSSVMLSKPNSNIYLNSFCFGFRFSSFKKIYPKFMQYLLRSETNRRSISILAQGATRYNLSKVQLMNITLFLPTLAEQQKIAQVLTAADREIEILQQKLAKLQQEKQALMQQLLTGKRRVKADESDLVTS